MFEGEKTIIFWIGLIILSLASMGLFTIVWLVFVHYPTRYHAYHWDYPKYFHTYFWKYYVWFILGGIVFIIVGLYMMKSGLGKEK